MSFVVISHVKYPAELAEKIQQAGQDLVPVIRAQPGIISFNFHKGNDENCTMMYWECESDQAYAACFQAPEWLSIMEENKALFASEGVEFAQSTYTKLA
ncbi:putative quinol monooxygenase [Sessilibacter corallicola]|uniref:putative quinol monooxygenase n=1 Tax=Sessilibacter corallicola TaxID=2904075 RepID=UPI001E43AE2F|nr:antibiotic biosynthesis monooxygenase [Sessilibacter corallicola]MCE2026780.1 antibiotic biosynthesis monooxygenase [Sessilibacter corallicola]